MSRPHDPRPDPPPDRDPRCDTGAADLDLWARAKAVFLDVFERPASERGAFLLDACGGDARLQREVESLLESERAAADLWETGAVHLLGEDSLSEAGLAEQRLRPGERLGDYEIRDFIAAGGMGAVYHARDIRLGRDVAIKTLVSQTTGESAARRLIREARHASVLSHPNVCTIYEVGEGERGPFIVMQYVPGRPLSTIVRDALPSVDVALTLGIQIADALEHAHQNGIIHRDLKSSNIVVNASGQPIILDFGLAKRLPALAKSQSGEVSVTHDGLAGTLSHMAPEVLLGGTADVRSDVWALGVLLYELMTGALPFTGRTPYETSSAILGDPPRPIGGHVPLALRLVIERCLAKDPDRRFQRAGDVRAALDAVRRQHAWPLVGRLLVSVRRRTILAGGGALIVTGALAVGATAAVRHFAWRPADVSTLAILPLRNATGDPRADYYANGITDALTTQFGAASSVRIISPTSAARVAASARTVREAGTQLGADAVLEGAVRKTGERVAIDVHLTDAASGRSLWSDEFERDAHEVLALEADVVRNLAFAIRLTLRADARDRLSTVRAVTPDAYAEYLKGRYEWNSRTPRSLQLAIDHFTRAIDLDPTYAPAHAALADCYNQLGTVMVGTGSPQQLRPRAAAEAIKALQLDPFSAEAHAALGYVYHYDWQWANAEKEFRRAIALNPNYSLVRIWYANLLMSRGRMTEAVQQAFAARELDSFSLIVNTNVAWVLDFAGRRDEAVAQLRKAIELDSTYVQAHWRLTDALQRMGRLSEAREQAERLVALTKRSSAAVGLLAVIHAKAGERERARPLLRELLARSRTEYVPSATISGVYLALGQTDSAMTWLEKAFAERSNAMAYLVANPDAAPLRGDPRYEAMVARVGLK